MPNPFSASLQRSQVGGASCVFQDLETHLHPLAACIRLEKPSAPCFNLLIVEHRTNVLLWGPITALTHHRTADAMDSSPQTNVAVGRIFVIANHFQTRRARIKESTPSRSSIFQKPACCVFSLVRRAPSPSLPRPGRLPAPRMDQPSAMSFF